MVKKLLPYLTLFSSLSTLICCALPALLVSLGFGATLVSVLTTFPQLIWLSEHKTLVFSVVGGCLLFAWFARYNAESLICPSDPKLAESCGRARRISGVIFYISLGLYLVGGFFAFIAHRIYN